MKFIEQLLLKEQDSTAHCFSCGRVVPPDQLRMCVVCRDPICGIDGCSRLCACGDFEKGLMDLEDLLANRWGTSCPVQYHKLLLQESLLQNVATSARATPRGHK